MKLNHNDKLLLAVLPALLAAAAYGYFWVKPTVKETRGLESTLQNLGTEEQILSRREQLNANLTRAREKLAALEAKEAAEPQAQAPHVEDAATSLSRLQEIFHRNGIRVVSALVEDERNNAKDIRVPQVLVNVGVPQPKTWNVTVEAPYEALIRLLDDCSTNRFPIIPETLSMRPGAGEGKPNYWTISLCL